jgi:hypothetical protein
MDEAVIRLKLAADAGADVCFIEGVKSKELLESTVKALAPKPVSFETSNKYSFLCYCPGPGECNFWWPHPVLHNEGG